MVEGAGALLLQKLDEYLKGRHHNNLNLEICNELEKLREAVLHLTTQLMSAERKRGLYNNESPDSWIRSLREIIYNIEDEVDKIMLLQHERIPGRTIKKQLAVIRRSCNAMGINNDKTKSNDADDLEASKALSLGQTMTMGLEEGDQGMFSSSRHNAEVADAEVSKAGWEHDGIQNKLEQLLLGVEEDEHQRQRLKVILVTGTVGIGKTFVVSGVWSEEKIKRYFDCRAWVAGTSSREPKDALSCMLDDLCYGTAPFSVGTMEVETLMQAYNSYLQGKRFLVVLDDVQDIHIWNLISPALPRNSGGRVIITTRNVNIAQSCIDDIPYTFLHVGRLNHNDAFDLFCKIAFNYMRYPGICPPELKEVAHAIVTECNGVPLAIVTIAAKLTDPGLPSDAWSMLLRELKQNRHLNPASAEDPDVNITDTALILSYNVLDFPLKYILLYCCLFPADRNIRVRKFIRLCVAEGFAKDKKHITAEKTMATYLKQLIDQKLILATRIGFSGNVETCRVGDTLRNLLLPTVENARFREFCTYKNDTRLRPKDVRRWSVVGNSSNIPSNKDDVAFVRSCFMSDIENLQSSSSCLSLLGGLRLLRVLDLKGANVPENLVQHLGDLIFLRYLGLRATNIKKLPTSLSNLHNLQTLDIRETHVTNLPDIIMTIGQLRHIHLAGSFVRKVVDLPLRRGKLEPLQILTLAGVRATTQLIKELGHCTLLQKLSIGDVRSDDSAMLCASINNMNSLQSLTIKTYRVEKLQMGTLSHTRNWSSVDTLKVGGPIEALPHVVNCFRSLSRLNLWDSKLDEDPFLCLQGLPGLACLCLSNAYEGKQLMCDTGGFPSLKKLSILRMRKLEYWKIDQGGMPSLEELFVGYCPKLKEVPQGLEDLDALQLVRVSEIPQEFTMALGEKRNDRFKILSVPQFVHI